MSTLEKVRIAFYTSEITVIVLSSFSIFYELPKTYKCYDFIFVVTFGVFLLSSAVLLAVKIVKEEKEEVE